MNINKTHTGIKGFLRVTVIAMITAAMALCSVGTARGEEKTQERIQALDEMSFIDMIHSVDPGDGADLIRKFQAKEGRTRLRSGKYGPKSGCNVELYRNKEVLLITIPASLLFAPNSADLLPDASEYLSPIKRYLKSPDMYRVLVTMHTDNTGSELYREEITQERVESVFEWFEESGADTRYMFSYFFGDDLPLKPNTSFENRAANRRLEIYLVPGKKMVEQAKKGKISF